MNFGGIEILPLGQVKEPAIDRQRRMIANEKDACGAKNLDHAAPLRRGKFSMAFAWN